MPNTHAHAHAHASPRSDVVGPSRWVAPCDPIVIGSNLVVACLLAYLPYLLTCLLRASALHKNINNETERRRSTSSSYISHQPPVISAVTVTVMVL